MQESYYNIVENQVNSDWSFFETTFAERFFYIMFQLKNDEMLNYFEDLELIGELSINLEHSGVMLERAAKLMVEHKKSDCIKELVSCVKEIVTLVPIRDFISEADHMVRLSKILNSNLNVFIGLFSSVVLKSYGVGTIVGAVENTDYILANKNKNTLDFIMEFLSSNEALKNKELTQIVIQGSDAKRIQRSYRKLNSNEILDITVMLNSFSGKPKDLFIRLLRNIRGELLSVLGLKFSAERPPASIISMNNSSVLNLPVVCKVNLKASLALTGASEIINNSLPVPVFNKEGHIITLDLEGLSHKTFSIHSTVNTGGYLVYHLIGSPFEGNFLEGTSEPMPSPFVSIDTQSFSNSIYSISSEDQLELIMSFLYVNGLLKLSISRIKKLLSNTIDSKNKEVIQDCIRVYNNYETLYGLNSNKEVGYKTTPYESMIEIQKVLGTASEDSIEFYLDEGLAGEEIAVTTSTQSDCKDFNLITIVPEDSDIGLPFEEHLFPYYFKGSNLVVPEGYKLVGGLDSIPQMTEDAYEAWCKMIGENTLSDEDNIIVEEDSVVVSDGASGKVLKLDDSSMDGILNVIASLSADPSFDEIVNIDKIINVCLCNTSSPIPLTKNKKKDERSKSKDKKKKNKKHKVS